MADNEDQTYDLLPAVDDQAIIAQITKAAESYEEVKASFVENFIFDGASLSEWTKRLYIQIGKDPTQEDMRALWVALTKKMQIAGNYYSISSAIASGIDNGSAGRKADVMTAIARNYEKQGKKRPAEGIISGMADSYMGTALSAKAAAIIVKNFWRQRLDTLIEMRKTLEQLGINMHIERKYENGE
jgi:hypothetical protein